VPGWALRSPQSLISESILPAVPILPKISLSVEVAKSLFLLLATKEFYWINPHVFKVSSEMFEGVEIISKSNKPII
jgi:hypothetical protein